MPLIDNIPYEHSDGNKRYQGLILNDSEFRDYLNTRVNEKFYDAEGTLNLEKMFQDVSQAGFDPTNLTSLFASEEIPIDWKIGEKISECFLEDNRNSIFPYNDSRDAKDSRSNLPGTDMVGLVKIDEKIFFLFGEVKTSDEDQYPPGVVYGKDGLINQLNEVKSNSKKRKELIRWLGHKIIPLDDSDSNKLAWKKATLSYVKSKEKQFKIFGVMIRGVVPKKQDLESVYAKIILNMQNETYLELISLYLPIKKSQYVEIMGDSR